MIDISPRTTTSTSTSSKRSSRVEKPRSSHNSPKALQQRRRTTSSVKKYVGLDDHWEMMFGQQDSSSFSSNNRPVSWHPTTSYYPESYISSPADDLCSQTGSYGFPDQTSPYPSSSAVAYVSALAERKRNYPPSSIGSPDVSMDPTPFPVWQDPCTPDSTFAMTSFPPMASQQDWTSMAAAPSAQPTSHPRLDSNSSSEFSSMQADDNASDYMADDDDDAREPETVLVGMGLYDPPSYESMLTSGLGKGLKLEETWQPPAEKENDDDEEEDEDEPEEDEDDDDTDDSASSESESSVEEPPAPATVDRWSTLHPASAAAAPAVVMPTDMAGQGFVLENLDAGDSTYATEWWYQQHQQQQHQAAKQPMMGLGYGWLPHHHRAQC